MQKQKIISSRFTFLAPSKYHGLMNMNEFSMPISYTKALNEKRTKDLNIRRSSSHVEYKHSINYAKSITQ